MLIVHITNTDPAGSVYNFVRAMNEHTEHTARMISTHAIPGFDFPKDIMDIFDGGDEIEALLKKADVIHFHKTDDSFNIELALEKTPRIFQLSDYTKGKKVVHHIHGAPYERANPKEEAEKYAKTGNLVLCSTPDLEEMYKAHYSRVQYFPNCVPINDVKYLPRATDEPLTGADGVTKRYCIFQSGTHSVLKNTHIIRDVMDKLAVELPIFFLHTTPENIQSQDMTLRHKRVAHVVFDHIEGYYGLSSLEGLSMGKPTIAGLSDYTMNAICQFFNVKPSDLPWIIAKDAAEIESKIRALIASEGWRTEVGEKSRKFMQEVWSDAAIAKRLADIYQSL